MIQLRFPLAPVVLLVLGAACSAQVNPTGGSGGTGGTGGGSTGGTGGTGGSTSTGGSGGIQIGGFGGQGTGGVIECDPGPPSDDHDGDGFTEQEGDCNDCDPNVGPNALEAPTAPNGNPIDENCDGQIDEPLVACDDLADIDELDPEIAVHAVDLCKQSAAPDDWGIVDVAWVLPDGSPVPPGYTLFHDGHGVLDGFGPNVSPKKGERLLALSSGSARQPTDPGYHNVSGYDKGTFNIPIQPPFGFPKESPLCGFASSGEPHDAAGIELTLRAPQNAHGFSFDFNFYSFEWPSFVCTSYNDFFVANLEPFPAMQLDGNISFDSQGNPVSVNNALMQVCGCPGNPPNPCVANGKSFNCEYGNVELIGTGFGFDLAGSDHAATGWLRTTAPVEGGSEFHLRWTVYDAGDGVLDSTTLIDNFQWVLTPGITVITQPPPN